MRKLSNKKFKFSVKYVPNLIKFKLSFLNLISKASMQFEQDTLNTIKSATTFDIRENGGPDSFPKDADLEEERKTLNLFQKFKHKKWQLRRDSYVELSDLFFSKRALSEIEVGDLNLENIVPWLQAIISEPNQLALQEGLKAVNAFLTHYTFAKGNMVLFVGSLLDKLVVTKTTINQLVHSIFEKLTIIDDVNMIPAEILKRVDNKNFKFLNSLLIILNRFFQLNNNLDVQMVRTSFKMLIPMLEHTNKEIRITSLDIIKTIYSLAEESYEELQKTVFSNLRNIHLKGIEILKTVSKAKFKKLIKLNDGIFGGSKANDNQKSNINSEQKIDIFTILPDKFLELPYVSINNQNEKKKKLEELNQNLFMAIKKGANFDIMKDYTYLINLLNNVKIHKFFEFLINNNRQ